MEFKITPQNAQMRKRKILSTPYQNTKIEINNSFVWLITKYLNYYDSGKTAQVNSFPHYVSPHAVYCISLKFDKEH